MNIPQLIQVLQEALYDRGPNVTVYLAVQGPYGPLGRGVSLKPLEDALLVDGTIVLMSGREGRPSVVMGSPVGHEVVVRPGADQGLETTILCRLLPPDPELLRLFTEAP